MRGLLIVLCVLTYTTCLANTKVLHIGLFYGNEPTEVIVQTGNGSYNVLGNGLEILTLEKNTILRVKNIGGLVNIRTLSKDLGTYKMVQFVRNIWGSSLKIQHTNESKTREYYDNFTIQPLGQKLRIINEVYIEHYVAGVVESEAGTREPKEYYKVQAVICRTYALNNRRRHEAEGFQLCDRVHCQVYNSMNRNNAVITEATNETSGIVIVDSDINLVTAAFHSNCGGHTANSEDVWSSRLDYLRAREDENCLEEPHAYWRFATTRAAWENYLRKTFDYPFHDELAQRLAFDYCPDERQHDLVAEDGTPVGIDLKQVRRDLNLRSAYFSIDQVQDSIILEGRGYGHGVGLCQEGAMNMAKRGFTYDQILHYYYSNVHLLNLSVIDFFRSN
ncbi:MAG: hypothetical protein Kow0075_13140 [Salibacteraceae bacterium]